MRGRGRARGEKGGKGGKGERIPIVKTLHIIVSREGPGEACHSFVIQITVCCFETSQPLAGTLICEI